ncbi:MAG: alcohol dehydrogenase catalytic domain-containing protein [candidate division NC10 bacterium]|nr:alcohol dehydrogenase catalytic domain-containing protein [candidate division NC10 bacterium]
MELGEGMLPATQRAIVFPARGRAEVRDVPVPRFFGENGSWNVVLRPLAVGRCPSDTASCEEEFPPGFRLPSATQAVVPGHEQVVEVVGASEAARRAGIEVGGWYVYDINIGCGEPDCYACSVQKRPGIDCSKGTLFQGIGAANETWVLRQTGLRHVPGSYVYDPVGRRGGIMVGRHTQLHRVDRSRLRDEGDLAVLTQADGLACAYTAIRGVAKLHAWEEGYRPALFLIGGGGRIAYWLAEAALAERGPDGVDLFLADVDADRLALTAARLGLPRGNTYLVDANNPDAFCAAEIRRGLPNLEAGRSFNLVLDAAGHKYVGAAATNRMFREKVLDRNGTYITTAHGGIPGLDVAAFEVVFANQRFSGALSPHRYIPRAVAHLQANLPRYAPHMVITHREIDDSLAQKVRTAGKDPDIGRGANTYIALWHRNPNSSPPEGRL